MVVPFKKYIEAIKPYEPGKPIDEVKRELGLSEVVKLASNENNIGLSERVKEAITNDMDSFFRYPDGGTWKVREKLSAYLGVDSNQIVLGSGSNEIIEFIAKGFIEHGDEQRP